MFTFSNPFFAYIKYTEVYFKRGKYLKKKKSNSWTKCAFSNFLVHENVNKRQRVKMLWFLFLEGERVFERLDLKVLEQTQGDDSQEGLYSCLWGPVALCSLLFHKQSSFLFTVPLLRWFRIFNHLRYLLTWFRR